MTKIYLFILGAILCLKDTLMSQEYPYFSGKLDSDLVGIEIFTMHRQADDLLYVGSDLGLLIFDGIHFDNYRRPHHHKDSLNCIYPDGDSYLLGYEDGSIYRFNQLTFQVEHDSLLDLGAAIKDMKRDRYDRLWIATYGEGIYYLQDDQLHQLNKETVHLNTNDIYALDFLSKDQLLIGTDLGGYIIRLTADTFQLEYPQWNDDINHDIISSINTSSTSGSLILNTFENGVFEINPKGHLSTRFDYFRQIEGAQAWGSSIVYFNKNDGQLYVENKKITTKIKLYGLPFELEPAYMYIDKEGFLWIWCGKNGLLWIPPGSSVLPTKNLNIQAIFASDSIIFIGGRQGLQTYSYNGYVKTLLWDENVSAVQYIKETNTVWCGTLNNGLVLINLTTGRLTRFTEKEGLANNGVLAIYILGKQVYVSTLGGINILNRSNYSILDAINPAFQSLSYVYDFYIPNNGESWIGMDGKGVTRITQNKTTKSYLAGKSVYHFKQISSNQLFLIADPGGLYTYEMARDTFVRADLFNLSEQFLGVTSDSADNLYLLSAKGLLLYNPATSYKKRIDVNKRFNPSEININAISSSPGGTITYGIGSELWMYHPYNNQEKKPGLKINFITLGDKSLLPDQLNTLPHTNRVLNVDFNGIWFDAPLSIHYRYILKGFDTDWKYTNDQSIVYSNIPSGEYTFLLETSPYTDFSSATQVEYRIRITPPYWETLWFRILALLILGGLIFWVYKSRMARKLRFKAMETEKLKSDLRVIKSQISPHFLFNSFNTLINIIEEDEKQAVKFTQQLSDYYRYILSFGSVELISMEKEIELMNLYLSIMKQRFGDNFSLTIQGDMKPNSKIIPFSIQLLIENIIKHNAISNKLPMKATMHIRESYLEICNPIHPKTEKVSSTHFGLQSLVQRYRHSHGKEVKVIKDDHKFCVQIPIINSNGD